jgi:hypothetical protein
MEDVPKVKYKVEKWSEPFDLQNTTVGTINGYLLRRVLQYRESKQRLWTYFHEDFKGFTVEIWKKADKTIIRELREVLILHGVWVQPVQGTSYVKVLQNCLQEQVPHAWDDELEQECLQLLKKAPKGPELQFQQYTSRAPLPLPEPLQRQPNYGKIQTTQIPQIQQYRPFVQPQPQYSIQPLFVQPQVLPQFQYQAPFVQPQVQPQSQYQALAQRQAPQRSVQYDDDDNWSWPSNKQEQQETSKSHEQPDFSYEVNDDDSQSEGEDWDDDGYSDDYSDNDYE